MAAVRIDGNILYDAGLTGVRVTAISQSTPSITTDGGTWTVGNVVTGPATNITATYVSADAAAKTMTVSSLVGSWSANTGNFVENTVVNPIQIKPVTSAITTVTGNVLTLTDDKDLAQFAVGANVYPDPPVDPSFAATTYTGNSTSQSITTGLRPGLVWLKSRSSGSGHVLFDAVRGGSNALFSNNTLAETGQYQKLSSFDSSGFTLSSGTDGSNPNEGNTTGNSYIAWTWSAGENSNHTYAITVANPGSGNKYYADGALQPTLTLAEGSTYKFDQSSATNATHPLKLSTTSDGTHGGGTEYTTGVTTVGTPGSAGAYTQVVIAASAPTLYTYCTAHSGMGFQINTSDTAGYTIPVGGLNSSVYDQSAVWSNYGDNTYISSSYPWSKAFDGVATGAYQNGATAVDNQWARWTPTGGITVSSSLRINTDNGSTSAIKVKFTGQTVQHLTSLSDGWNSVSGTGTLEYIEVYNTGGTWSYLCAVEVDNKVVIDSGVTPPTNLPSIASRVQANPSAGFSIVKFTAGSTAGSIGHSLSAQPKLILMKTLDLSLFWFVYTDTTGAGKYLKLNETATTSTDSTVFSTAPSSSVFYPGTGFTSGNGYGDTIAYCWSEVSGYSKFGSYTGTSSSVTVTTGFRPKYVLVRNTSGAYDWVVVDSARSNADAKLFPNTSAAESAQDAFDFNDDGFTIKVVDWPMNKNGDSFIYAAFGEGGGPTGVVGSISNLDMTLSASTGTWEVGQKVTKDIGPAIEATANLIFNSSGAVSGLTTTEVAGQLMTDKDAPKLTFAAGPGTGETWDQELPAGTHLQTSFVATNVEGTSSATSNEITPT
jgi:hypothetical protein